MSILSVGAAATWLLMQGLNSLVSGQPARLGFWPLTAQESPWPWTVTASVPVLVGLWALTVVWSRQGLSGAWRASPVPVAVMVTSELVLALGVAVRSGLLAWSAAAWILTAAVVLVAVRNGRGVRRWSAALIVAVVAEVVAVAGVVGVPRALTGGPQTLAVRSYELSSVALSRDGRYLATMTGFGDLQVEDRQSGTVTRRKLDQGSGWVRFSVDGRQLWVATYQGNRYVLELGTGAWTDRPMISIVAASFATGALGADGTVVEAPPGVVPSVVRGAPTSKPGSAIPGLSASDQAALVSAAGVSADGRVGAVGYDNGEVMVAELSSGRQLSAVPISPGSGTQVWVPYKRVPAGAVSAVAVSADGTSLAVATVDGRIRIVDVVGGATRTEMRRPLLSGDGGRALALEFSSDGRRLLAGYLDGSVQLWTVPGR